MTKFIAFAVFFFLALCYVIYMLFNPYDWVEVTIEGLPADTKFVCVVTESQDQVMAMNWYHFKVFPVTIHPDSDVGSYHLDVTSPLRRNAAWVTYDKIGILRKSENGDWQIAWYKPPKADLEGRSFLFGGGRWKARWRDADQLQEPNPGLLRSMGFENALKNP